LLEVLSPRDDSFARGRRLLSGARRGARARRTVAEATKRRRRCKDALRARVREAFVAHIARPARTSRLPAALMMVTVVGVRFTRDD
jgi:hypothetical protein